MIFGNNLFFFVYNFMIVFLLDLIVVFRYIVVFLEVCVNLSFKILDVLVGVVIGEGWEDRVGGGVLVSMVEKWGKNK